MFLLKDEKRISKWTWERCRNRATITPDDKFYCKNYDLEQPKFISVSYDNTHLDGSSRRAAIKAAQSVVSLIIYSDNKEIFQGTGTVIDTEGTILTLAKLGAYSTSENKVAENIKVTVYLWDETSYDAELSAYDFYYDIAIVKIQHDVPQLKPAFLRLVDDCVSLELPFYDETPSRSHKYNLVPGDKIIALGRYFIKPYDLMAAPGEFSVNHIDDNFECKELFRANCEITMPGIGGPIINLSGEVIGIASYDSDGFTPFLPLNIALKWWELYKKFRAQPGRPFIGMQTANLYTVCLKVSEKFTQKTPNYFVGVIVKEVVQGSSADIAGIRPNDLIVESCGKPVRSFLEFYDIMWDNVGNLVTLVVVRASDDDRLEFSMDIVDATQGGW